MATVYGLLSRLSSLDIYAVAAEVIEEHQQKVVYYSTLKLFEKGQDRSGFGLKPYRNKEYEDYKHSKNPRPGRGIPDLFETGNFYKGISISDVNKSVYNFLSSDAKTEKLIKNYGKDIIGLSDEYKAVMVDEFLYNEIMIRVKQKLKL
jgi:hypothetical protein